MAIIKLLRQFVKILALVYLFCFSLNFLKAQPHADTIKKVSFTPRIYKTQRLTTPKPIIDGKLDDACWKTGEWTGDFTQWLPHEGTKPSQPTELKILYDDKNIYVAIRAYDNEPARITRHAARRDRFEGDVVGICFDSYHDHRTGFEFDITAYGQKIDVLLTNPANSDFSWNAVWTGRTGIEDSAWVAEMEIPFSQLRYSNAPEQVWGLHCWRWIDRLQEESDWEPQTSSGPGMLYMFGELHGINGLKKNQRIELMPYVVGKLNTFEKEANNPFTEKGYNLNGTLGLDAKIGLSSNFTMDLTINPDFGQVEADPSVMNLTAFETFYEEKRPFFLEGKNIFNYSLDDASLFYSRRIGHAPAYVPAVDSGVYLKKQESTSIIDALKVSGKTAGGLSIGIMQSLTSVEKAYIAGHEDSIKKIVTEPYTNYLLGRIQKDSRNGNTVIGGIFSATNRFIRDDHLQFLNKAAYAGGIDLLQQWKNKEYYMDLKFLTSYITGSQNAMLKLQQSSARYYQRPDAKYLHIDSSASYMAGTAGSFEIGRKTKGKWNYSAGLTWFSPGAEFNDLGYLKQADVIKQINKCRYMYNKSFWIFRRFYSFLIQSNQWDFGGRYLFSDVELQNRFEFSNRWALEIHPGFQTRKLDTRQLRGGEAMLFPSSWRIYWLMQTDYSRRIYSQFSVYYNEFPEISAQYIQITPAIIFRPLNALRLYASCAYTYNIDPLQYVTQLDFRSEKRYLLGSIHQQNLEFELKVDLSITPDLTIQYYGSPFVSKGLYSEFKRVTQPASGNYSSRFEILNTATKTNGIISFDEDMDVVNDYSIPDPDFNFLQFRSNMVFRWEFKPGSVLYLVWSMDKTGFADPIDISMGRSLKQLSKVNADNIFLIKLNYWFGL